MTDPVLLFHGFAALVVVGCILKVGRQILHQDSGGWDSTEEQVIEGVVILRAEPVVQYREPIEVRRIPARVSHASPETATGSVAYPGRHRRTGAPTPREAALTTRTQALFVRTLEQAGETPPATFGPREPVHTRTYTPPEAWEQPGLPLRGMPPIVEEVKAL